jgi:predicted RNA-binding Zn-ribbon protein involved in translation (DUF1610 family)
MKRTINSTDTAKKIAADHGLTFTYSRSRRVWILAARHHVAGMMNSEYTPGEIAGFDTDTFYQHCTEVATHTATPDQMHKVFQRAKHAELFDMLEREGREKFTDDERAQWLELDPTSHDKQVHAIEDAIYQMRLDAEEIGGTYAEHKAKFAGVRAVASYGKGKHIGYSVDGRFVMSLPAQLNNGRIPCAEECDDILNGESVTDSDGWRNRAHDLYELARRIVDDTVMLWPGAKVGAAMVATSDGTVSGVRFLMWCGKRRHSVAAAHTCPLRLHAHWRGFLENCAAALAEEEAPRVDLSKPAAAPHVASVLALPALPNAEVMERTRAALAERRTNAASVYDQMQERRRASVPAVHVEEVEHVELPAPPAVVYVPLDVLHDAPGDPCPTCGACLHAGQDMCDDCRQNAPALVNLYQCPLCTHEWREMWTSATPDDCPNCGAHDVEPYDTETAEHAA